MKKQIAEVIGTFALVFFGCGTILFMGGEVGMIGISFAFGLAVTAMAYGIGPISGAHLNPAVSLGVMMAGKMSSGEMIGYWIAQVIGGLAAAVVLMAMGADVAGAATKIGDSGMVAALIFEIIATFIFVTVILGATQDGHATQAAGLAIGLTLVMIHLAGIQVSGSSVNPARSIATNVFDTANLSDIWLYLAAPLLGGGVAGILHKSGVTSA